MRKANRVSSMKTVEQRLARVDINLLVTFSVIYKEKSVSKAGEHLFLSQSAMSRSLSRLRELFDDESICRILSRVGIHGDLTESEEERIDSFVIDWVEYRRWKGPDPANLYIPIALSRQFAAGDLDPANATAALEFIADRRCDDVVLARTSTYKPNRLSELLPIMRALERRQDLTGPYEKVRHRTLRRGESYFENEEQASMIHSKVVHFVFQQRFKYALLNRNPNGFERIISLLGLYAGKKIDHLESKYSEVLHRSNDHPLVQLRRVR